MHTSMPSGNRLAWGPPKLRGGGAQFALRHGDNKQVM